MAQKWTVVGVALGLLAGHAGAARIEVQAIDSSCAPRIVVRLDVIDHVQAGSTPHASDFVLGIAGNPALDTRGAALGSSRDVSTAVMVLVQSSSGALRDAPGDVRAAVTALGSGFGESSRVALYRYAAELEEVVPFGPQAGLAGVTQLSYAGTRKRLLPALSQALSILERQPEERRILAILSDGYDDEQSPAAPIHAEALTKRARLAGIELASFVIGDDRDGGSISLLHGMSGLRFKSSLFYMHSDFRIMAADLANQLQSQLLVEFQAPRLTPGARLEVLLTGEHAPTALAMPAPSIEPLLFAAQLPGTIRAQRCAARLARMLPGDLPRERNDTPFALVLAGAVLSLFVLAVLWTTAGRWLWRRHWPR